VSKLVVCITCSKRKRVDSCISVLNEPVCRDCAEIITQIHMYTHQVKWVCPHCQAEDVKCQHCDLTTMLRQAKLQSE
jgi:hypothetical protein